MVNWCRKFAKKLVLKAEEHGYAITFEDLKYLRENIAKKENIIVWKLSLFAYRKLQEAIISKAIEHNVPIILVNPRNTSTTCPRCGAKLVYNHRLAICRKCRFIADRNVVGAMNIWSRSVYAYAGKPGSPQSAPAMNDETRGSGRTKDEGMKKVFRSIQK